MFLNNISIYTIPVVGILFLIISLTYSKTIHAFSYRLSRRKQEEKYQPVNNQTNDDSHISIQVNPLSQFDNHQIKSDDDDDDDDLIILDTSASNFCQTKSIKLRLDQDMEYDDN
jgi:hypothetical protein